MGQSVKVTYVNDSRQFTVRDMLRTRQFWLLFFNFLCNTQAVFFSITYSKIVAASTITGGASDAALTTIVALGALINGMGRLFWGTLNDKTGFRSSMMMLCSMQSVLVILMPFCHVVYGYGIVCWAVLFCDIFSLFPSTTATYFGAKNIGSNYGIVFLGFTLGMGIAPRVAQAAVSSFGLNGLCWTTAVFVVAGGLMASQNSPPTRHHNQLEEPLIDSKAKINASPSSTLIIDKPQRVVRSTTSVLNIDRLGLVVEEDDDYDAAQINHNIAVNEAGVGA